MIQRVNPYIASADSLLLDHLSLLVELDRCLPILDLACGRGRNGLALAEHGASVVFADKSSSALESVEQRLAEDDLPGSVWQVDLEEPGSNPFAEFSFGAVIGFRYLHRPLFPALKNSVIGGGLLVYETFTIEQRRFGRPNNPDYLLQPNELQEMFQAWEIIYHFEGVQLNPERHVAQIVARKPARYGNRD